MCAVRATHKHLGVDINILTCLKNSEDYASNNRTSSPITDVSFLISICQFYQHSIILQLLTSDKVELFSFSLTMRFFPVFTVMIVSSCSLLFSKEKDSIFGL